MAQGMTGFGRGECVTDTLAVTVDLRTVNHRFLDIDLRGATLPPAVARRVRDRLGSRLSRGKIEAALTLQARTTRAAALRVDRGALMTLVEALRDVAREVDVTEPLTMSHLAALPWQRAIEPAAPDLDEAEERCLLDAIDEALTAVMASRSQEGRELADDIRGRAERVGRLVEEVRVQAAAAPERHLERLRGRLALLIGDAGISEERLAQEAALLADRADVAEELTRLAAFVERIRKLLERDEAIGKTLDFTLQEAFREVNTIGSKAKDLEVADRVIEMKAELERMREQAANVE